jgi:hypothetical protein
MSNVLVLPDPTHFIGPDDDPSFMCSFGHFSLDIDYKAHEVTYEADKHAFANRDAFKAAEDDLRAQLKAKLPPGPWTIKQEFAP